MQKAANDAQPAPTGPTGGVASPVLGAVCIMPAGVRRGLGMGPTVHESRPIEVEPAPTDDEAAAIVVALAAYLGEQRARGVATPPVGRWALAGRLASQGQGFARLPGIRTGWGNAGRVGQWAGRRVGQ